MNFFCKLTQKKRLSVLVVLIVLFVLSGASILYMQQHKKVTGVQKDIAEASRTKVPKKSSGLYLTDAKTTPTTFTVGKNF